VGVSGTGTLEYRALGEYPRSPAATFGSLPLVFAKRSTCVERREPRAQAVLQTFQIGAHRV
jgi:hypothetical protein